MIRAGAMRHQVTIQTQSTTLDAAGQPLRSWSTFATRRASVDRTPGSEVFASAERSGRVPTVFRLRWLDGVTPGMRLVWDSRVFDIKSAIDQSGLGEELLITADELVGEMP